MKSSTKNTLVSVALAGSFASGVSGQEVSEESILAQEQGISHRFFTQYSGDLGDANLFTTTWGFGDAGIYDTRRNSSAQFFETFRLRDVVRSNGNDFSHYVAAGARLNDLGENTSAIVFGNTGDINGIGAELEHRASDFTFTFTGEKRFDSIDADSASRLGFGLDYQVTDNFRLGFGFDRTSTSEGNRDQYLVNGVFDLSDTDFLGLAFVETHRSDGSTDNSLGGAYLHYGKDEDWGIRWHNRFDWNNERDSRSFSTELILAQNPTTGMPGARWMVERHSKTDGMYNQSVFSYSLSTEATPLLNRASSGLSFLLKGSLTDVEDAESGFFRGAVGYTWSNGLNKDDFGIYAGATHKFEDEREDLTIVDFGAIFNQDNSNSLFEIGLPVSGDGETLVKTGIGWRF